MRPELILHPGFPKCGTTSLQKLFIIEDHALPRALGIGFLGADFKPNNGYPPVSRLMYDYQGAVEVLLSNDYAPGRYVLSNEAMSNRPELLKVIAEKFTILHAVFTVRHPALQSLSNYRYSGWLERDFATFLADQGDRLYDVDKKYRQPIEHYLSSCVPVRICPVEETAVSFEERFLCALLDEVPQLLHQAPFSKLGRANASVAFAFSDSLYRELCSGDYSVPQRTDRHALAMAAQQYNLPSELDRFAPASLAALDQLKLETSLARYESFLDEFSVDERIVKDVISFSRRQIEWLQAQPLAGPSEEAELRRHARRLLEQWQYPRPGNDNKAPTAHVQPVLLADPDGRIALLVTGAYLSNTPLALKQGSLSFVIVPAKQKICRLRLEGDFSALTRTTLLCFDFHSPNYALMPDIVAGDAGFPMITIVNSDNVYFSFARGNLKDFFDISSPNVRQEIELPLSAFTYAKDMVSNVPLNGDFFSKPITSIFFDFLRHPADVIDISIANFSYRNMREASVPPVQDLVVFDRNDQNRSLPKFATESGIMTFEVALNATALMLGYAGASLSLTVLKDGAEKSDISVQLTTENMRVKLELKERGAYRIRAKLSKSDTILAQEEWSACHVVPSSKTTPSQLLGISDAAEYDRIAMTGGSWDRLVFPLHALVKVKGEYRFQHGLDSLPRTRRAPGQHRILSTLHMPRTLSRFPDRWDFSRYGPADLGAYAELVSWLAKRAWNAGFTHYEVWNEASALGHWADDMDALISLHVTTHDAVRKVAPDMVVLGGCTHSWDMDFLRRFFEAGGGEHCDGLAIHGYTYQPERLKQLFDELESIIDTHVASDRDFGLHVTEVGFRMPAFSEMSQAECLSLFTLEAQTRRRSRAVLWFRFANSRPELDSSYNQRASSGYAMLGHGDRYCRAAYGAFRFMDWLLAESHGVTASGEGDTRLFRIVGTPGTVALATCTRQALDKATPPDWRKVDCLGGPLMERANGRLFIALRPGFCV